MDGYEEGARLGAGSEALRGWLRRVIEGDRGEPRQSTMITVHRPVEHPLGHSHDADATGELSCWCSPFVFEDSREALVFARLLIEAALETGVESDG